MKYISLQHLAKQIDCSPLITLEVVLEKKYHYIMTEANGMWVLVDSYDKPMTKQDIKRKIDAEKAMHY